MKLPDALVEHWETGRPLSDVLGVPDPALVGVERAHPDSPLTDEVHEFMRLDHYLTDQGL